MKDKTWLILLWRLVERRFPIIIFTMFIRLVKALVELKVALEVVVAVISQLFSRSMFQFKAWGMFLSFFCLGLLNFSTFAAVLPEDRADALVSLRTDGGGVEIHWPIDSDPKVH